MKKALALFTVVLALGMTLALDAQAAKRLGGGKSSGMQRQNVTAPANTPGGARNVQGAPAQAAPAAGAAAAPAAAATPKRSWMGPLAGLAAGLGLAALASHLGFGEALANMMMIGLLVMAVLLAVGFFLRKRAMGQGQPLAGAGAPAGMRAPLGRQEPQQATYRTADRDPQQGGALIGSRVDAGISGPTAAGAQAAGIPADFDVAGFERNAKAQFLALQAANDARDLDRLRDYLSPEMFDLVRVDLAERGDAPQSTEVFGLEAQVLNVTQDEAGYVASVRFTGRVRDQQGAVPEDLDETWHLSKPRAGQGGWVIAGIQQGGASS
jgi:predicted lipid-binding transport protein (Tim44 family)